MKKLRFVFTQNIIFQFTGELYRKRTEWWWGNTWVTCASVGGCTSQTHIEHINYIWLWLNKQGDDQLVVVVPFIQKWAYELVFGATLFFLFFSVFGQRTANTVWLLGSSLFPQIYLRWPQVIPYLNYLSLYCYYSKHGIWRSAIIETDWLIDVSRFACSLYDSQCKWELIIIFSLFIYLSYST